MVMQLNCVEFQPQQSQKARHVLSVLDAIKRWDRWHEVFLNCVKESPMSYEAFARAVQAGDSSLKAFDDALRLSVMSQEEFDRYLPEFQKYVALYTEYPGIGMLSDGVDQIWHGFMLVTALYDEFCATFIGHKMHHLPCSLYELYGIEVGSCINKCIPTTCKGDGGGCGPDNRAKKSDDEIKSSIQNGTQQFIHAYTDVFGSAPDVAIWNQLANY